jgi:hypothetical protein
MASARDIRLEMDSKPMTISWRNLKVTPVLPITAKCKKNFKSKDILNNLSGIVKPGEMVALMGAR